jgi:hypothetical protein
LLNSPFNLSLTFTRIRPNVKRQRTNSSEPESENSNPDSAELGSDQQEEMGRKKQTPRGAAARSQREKELRDRERERAEAASKRKGRADRRRGEGEIVCPVEPTEANLLDADTPEEGVRPSDTLFVDEATSSAPPEPVPAMSNSANKRNGGRNSGKRRGKGGNDNGSPAHLKNGKDSPKDGDEAASVAESTGTAANNGNEKPPSRRGRAGTNGHHREPTMSELKKRAALMLEFISQSRLEIESAESQGMGRSLTGSEAVGLGGDLADRLFKWQQEFTMEAAVSGDASSGQ